MNRLSIIGAPLRNISLVLITVMAGCAEHGGIYRTGDNIYTISKTAQSGEMELRQLESEAYEEGARFCRARGRGFKALSLRATHPPYTQGNIPRFDFTFQCTLE